MLIYVILFYAIFLAPGDLPVHSFWYRRPSPGKVSDQEPELPQCPVCNALLPRSVNMDEHVNEHFEKSLN